MDDEREEGDEDRESARVVRGERGAKVELSKALRRSGLVELG